MFYGGSNFSCYGIPRSTAFLNFSLHVKIVQIVFIHYLKFVEIKVQMLHLGRIIVSNGLNKTNKTNYHIKQCDKMNHY